MNFVKAIQARWKAIVALLGGVLGYLYQIQASNPNHYVALAIVVLTAIGVHQVTNQGA